MVGSECYVDGLDPKTRLILSIVLLIFILPLAVFIFMHIGSMAINALEEGKVWLFCLHLFFIGMTCFILFIVVAHLLLAILCIVG